MKERKKPEKFLLPHGRPSDDRSFAFSSRVLSKAAKIKALINYGIIRHRAAGLLEESRPSILALWGNDGKVSHQDAMDCIRLMGQEVMPALREMGVALGLTSP